MSVVGCTCVCVVVVIGVVVSALESLHNELCRLAVIVSVSVVTRHLVVRLTCMALSLFIIILMLIVLFLAGEKSSIFVDFVISSTSWQEAQG